MVEREEAQLYFERRGWGKKTRFDDNNAYILLQRANAGNIVLNNERSEIVAIMKDIETKYEESLALSKKYNTDIPSFVPLAYQEAMSFFSKSLKLEDIE